MRLREEGWLDVVTDGELRRYAFFGHLIEGLDGVDKFGGWAIPFRDEQGGALVFECPVVLDKLDWRRGMCGHCRRPAEECGTWRSGVWEPSS